MRKIGDHAVVLGASMGGLLAARVLADAYQRVTVVDRDLLLEGPADRRGVPQGRHAHALLARGAQILDELFPGLLADLAAAGVPVLASPRELWFSLGGHLLCLDGDGDGEDPGYLASRPYLEGQVRARSGRWTTSRSGTGARWPGWSPRPPGTGSPASGCGLPAAGKKK